MKKRLLSLFLAFVMTCSLLPAEVLAAETELSWSGNTIALAPGTTIGSYTLTKLQIFRQNATSTYPTITSVTQDGNIINITLAEDTDLSYPIQMGFSGDGGVVQNVNNKCTLSNGIGTATVSVQAKPAPHPNVPVLGTGTFMVNFGVEAGETYAVTAPIGEGFTFDGDEVARKGRDYTFKITANEGYDTSNAIVKVNGEVVDGIDGTYKVKSASEELIITVEGIIKKDVYSITAPVGDGFTFTGDETVYAGEDYTFSITADNAYDATNMVVKANSNELSGTNGKYTIAAVSENITITVEGLVKKTVYAVTLAQGEGYSISGQTTSYAGEPYSFTVNVSSGYIADEMVVKVNNEEVSLTNGSYTIPSLNGDTSVTVEGIRSKNVYNVSKNAEEGAVVNGNNTVLENDTYTFTVTVDRQYDATNMVVKVNGMVVTADNGTYKVENVTENLVITVEGLVKLTTPVVDPVKILEGGRKPDSSWGYVDTITIDGVQVEEYKWQGDTAYVVLTEDTADDAEVKVSFKTGGMRMGNMPDTSIRLENGEAEKSFTAKTTVFNYTWNFKLVFSNKGFEPTLADGANESDDVTAYVDNEFMFDVSDKFTSILGKELSYSVKEDDGEYVKLEGSEHKFTPSETGTKTLVFKANDGKLDSDKTYTLNITIENVAYSAMYVNVPENVKLTFYGGNEQEEQLEAELNENENRYTVTLPSKYTEINFLDTDNRGMTIPADADGEITVIEVETSLVNIANDTVAGTAKVTYGEYTAKSNGNSHLLAVDTEYTYTAQPNDSTYTAAIKKEVLEDNTQAIIQVGINNQATITVSDGAVPHLYKYNQYYSNTKIDHKAVVDNEGDTTTYYYSEKIGRNPYRVVKEGSITKAGWWDYGTSLTVLHTENDLTPDTRVDYAETGLTIGDDGVVVNVNGQNHLKLANVGSTYTLKAYRIWEIILYSYENRIITPEFHYNIISGNDVIKLTEKKSASTNDGDWMTVTALKEGTAVIEVTYDAMQVSGGHYPGIYGASDPARTGFIVVTVGNDTSAVDFGIKGKSSQGNLTYEKSTPKAWDAEFDTLYFTGEYGEIKLSPTVTDDTITEVAVSNDKGENWTILTANEGEYTAKITSGNNIIRVTTEKGVAYQIVRGDKVTVRMYNITNVDQPFKAGDTVRIYIDGLHQPIPKMAGNYNPGYKANTDGDSSTHMSFIWNGERVNGAGGQYAFAYSNNYIDVTIPENTEQTSFTLSEGCIATGVIGLKNFVNGGDSHRNIPDGGCTTRGSETTFHTRSVLPEITIELGGAAAENTAPYVKAGAQTEATITLGKTFAINLETIFEDAEGNELTYKLGEETLEKAYFTFTPDTTGEYKLIFTASDGDFEVSHTIILTVEQASTPSLPPAGDDFGLSTEEIEGYVYVSFEDNGERVEGESGVTYPEPLGTIIGRIKVPYKEGDTIADATLRLLYAKDMTASYSGDTKNGFYLGAIGNFTVDGIDYDSFGEFDAGVGSGWMITYNDVFIEYGASEFEVSDGDTIKWQYTCQYGADIGDPYFDSVGGTITPVKNAVDNVEELIDAIGDVTLDSKAAIEEARAAYDALTDSQKNLVENYNDLLNAESRYETLVKASEMPFADVENHWGIEAITYVYENEIMTGTSDATFDPDTALSRGMLATVLYRLAGSPEVKGENPFPDVKADEWYTDAVIWAYENGIVKGYDNGDFGPGDNITREQMAVMLMNYAQFKGIDTLAKNELSQFDDAENTSAWAVEAVKWAVAEGLITGRDTGLMPKAEANRAETATVLMRFMER